MKLGDFGIATALEETDEVLTREGMTQGTPSYIPPEQIENAKNVDKRADIYSLGGDAVRNADRENSFSRHFHRRDYRPDPI